MEGARQMNVLGSEVNLSVEDIFFLMRRNKVMRICVRNVWHRCLNCAGGVCMRQYSGTSDNGHSEEWTTSLQNGQTVCPPTFILSIHFYLRRRDNL